MKTFDMETFNRNKNESGEYTYRLNDNTLIKQQETATSFYEFITQEDNYFEEIYEYYKTGIIKTSFLYFRYDFMAGILKEYDEQGKLIRERDLDQPYRFRWEKILEYLSSHEVTSIKKQVASIKRHSDENEAKWILDFYGKYRNTQGSFVVVLDGKTGEEMEVKQLVGKTSLGETGTTADYKIIYRKEE